MSNIELNNVAHDLMEVRAMIKELEAEAEALTDQIKSCMLDRGEEVIAGDGWKAAWKNVVSSRLDTKALKEAMPDVVQRFTKTTTTTRFTLTV